MLSVAIALAALAQFTAAQQGEWAQCGGLNWNGGTTCLSPYVCTYSNPYYSQCLPATSTTTTTTTTTKPSTTTTKTSATTTKASTTTTKASTTTTKASTSITTTKGTSVTIATTTTKASTTTTANGGSATGYVQTSGQKFTLNGSTYTLVGSNAYWLAQLGSTSDLDQAFADIAATGATTVRTWGFNDVTSPSGTYYQLWSGSTATLNTGADGLQKFDAVVASAKAHGIRLIVTLTNNWSDYGGMDVYVKQILGSTSHDLFYSDPQVNAAYENYINGFVGRYKNEPTILAWELANEPRCTGSTGTSTGTCTTTTITTWVQKISAYIKSIDSNHLVSIGDEGFGLAGDTSYVYTTGPGTDFATNLAVSTVDFGTFHLYPESWGVSPSDSWGVKWITDHVAIQKSLNKPVILEEFGVTTGQQQTYTDWWGTVISSGLTGDLYWQAASTIASGYNDGYGILPGTALYTLATSHAAALKARG